MIKVVGLGRLKLQICIERPLGLFGGVLLRRFEIITFDFSFRVDSYDR